MAKDQSTSHDNTRQLEDPAVAPESASNTAGSSTSSRENPMTDGRSERECRTETVTSTDSLQKTESARENALLSAIAQAVETLLGYLGFHRQVQVERTDDGYLVTIPPRRRGSLLTARGNAALRAIEHLVLMIVRRDFPSAPAVFVEIAGYRQRRETFLCKKALAVAHIVIETGREMALDTLSEAETRAVREALRSLPSVRIHAVGYGPRRTVVIAPAATSNHSDPDGIRRRRHH